MGDMNNLIHDWNTFNGTGYPKPPFRVELDDETLRDGLQSPSVRIPPVRTRIKILHLINDLGIDTANIGLPGAGGVVKQDTLELAQEIVKSKLRVTPNCAARTLEVDVVPIVEIVQKVGIPIEACLFIGSSSIRQYAEGWTIDQLLEHTRKSVSFATKSGLPVMYVTEDTTRAKPEDLRRMYLTAIECGAKRICLADTVGHADPNGAFQLVSFIRGMLKSENITDVKVDWHGHMDRGLGVWNAVSALMAGANRVHGSAIGIGERVGNAAMDQLLVNLKLLGWIGNDLSKLNEYCQTVSQAVAIPIPVNYPVVGKDAFETATGVHAAAVIKALRRNDAELADQVYSGVPASWVGRKQAIRIGPLSGKSNVIWWLESRGIEASDARVTKIFEAAKKSDHILTDAEIEKLVAPPKKKPAAKKRGVKHGTKAAHRH